MIRVLTLSVQSPEAVAAELVRTPSLTRRAQGADYDWESKRAGSCIRPAGIRADSRPAISTKNKHLLPACAANPRIHGGCFGV